MIPKEAVEFGLADGAFPGASYAFGDLSAIEFGAVGRISPGSGAEVSPETIYDLASLTKVIVTAPLVHQSGLSLHTQVGAMIKGGGASRSTLRELLAHTSGLPAYPTCLPKQNVLAEILAIAPDRPGETQYSCIGFVVLQAVLEHQTGQSLDQLFSWPGLTFGPVPSSAPTGAKHDGFVHDPLARALGGVSGNAGLFGPVTAVAQFAQSILGAIDAAEPWALAMTEPATGAEGRTLGWACAQQGSSAGDGCSDRTFGHTGFTGTSIWIDPQIGRFGVLLTNRVLTCQDPALMLATRRRFHSACWLV